MAKNFSDSGLFVPLLPCSKGMGRWFDVSVLIFVVFAQRWLKWRQARGEGPQHFIMEYNTSSFVSALWKINDGNKNTEDPSHICSLALGAGKQCDRLHVHFLEVLPSAFWPLLTHQHAAIYPIHVLAAALLPSSAEQPQVLLQSQGHLMVSWKNTTARLSIFGISVSFGHCSCLGQVLWDIWNDLENEAYLRGVYSCSSHIRGSHTLQTSWFQIQAFEYKHSTFISLRSVLLYVWFSLHPLMPFGIIRLMDGMELDSKISMGNLPTQDIS